MLETLRRARVFRARDDSELEAIRELIHVRPLAQGETLFHSGDEGRAFWVLQSGLLRRTPGMQDRWTEGPGDRMLAPGALVGTSVLAGGTYRSTVVALERSTLLELGVDAWQHLPSRPAWLSAMLEELRFKSAFADQVLGWLRHTGLFKGLPPRELELVLLSMRLDHFSAGETVVRQGDPASSLGLIVRGEARMVLQVSPYRRVEIAALTEGDLYGESGLLDDASRETTLEATTPLAVLALERDAVLELASEAPYLLKTLLTRLGAASPGSAHEARGFAAVLVGQESGRGRSTLTLQLAASLAQEGKSVAVVDAVSPWQPFSLARMLRLPPRSEQSTSGDWSVRDAGRFAPGAGLERELEPIQVYELSRPSPAPPDHLRHFIEELKQRFDAVLIEAPDLSRAGFPGLDGLVEDAEWCLHVTERPLDEPLCESALRRELLRVVPERSGTISIPYIGRDIQAMPWDLEPARRFRETGIPWVLTHPRSRSASVVRRLKRALLRKQVGIALSGGANWGFSHVGVLQVLEQQNIPVDMVAGTSMGGIIGGLFAMGTSGKEIEEIFSRLIFPGFFKYIAPSFFIRDGGIIKGDTFGRLTQDLFKGRLLTELQRPFWPNAMDAASGEEVVFRQGPVYQGVTAAASLPGLFQPYESEGRMLLDGGFTNNLPLGILYELGCNISIGCNCVPHLVPESLSDPAPIARLKRAASRIKQQGGALHPLVGPAMAPVTAVSTMNMVMRGIQMFAHKSGEEAGRLADIYFSPEVGMAQWFEFHKVREMVEAGRRAADAQMPRVLEVCPRDV